MYWSLDDPWWRRRRRRVVGSRLAVRSSWLCIWIGYAHRFATFIDSLRICLLRCSILPPFRCRVLTDPNRRPSRICPLISRLVSWMFGSLRSSICRVFCCTRIYSWRGMYSWRRMWWEHNWRCRCDYWRAMVYRRRF